MPRKDGFDGCSCPKDSDAWGSDGWHWFEMTSGRFVADHVRFELSRRPHRDVTPEERRQFRLAGERLAEHYVGQKVAYEPCPEYQAATRRNRDQARREEAASRTRGRMRVV